MPNVKYFTRRRRISLKKARSNFDLAFLAVSRYLSQNTVKQYSTKIFFFELGIHFFKWKIKLVIFSLARLI